MLRQFQLTKHQSEHLNLVTSVVPSVPATSGSHLFTPCCTDSTSTTAAVPLYCVNPVSISEETTACFHQDYSFDQYAPSEAPLSNENHASMALPFPAHQYFGTTVSPQSFQTHTSFPIDSAESNSTHLMFTPSEHLYTVDSSIQPTCEEYSQNTASQLMPSPCEQPYNTDHTSATVNEYTPVSGSVDDFIKIGPTATLEKVVQLTQQLDGILQKSDQLSSAYNQSPNIVSTSLSHGELNEQSLEATFTIDGSPISTAKALSPSTSLYGIGSNPSYVRELEERNVNMAALLEKQSRAYELAMTKLAALQEQLNRASSQAATDRAASEAASKRDLNKAQDQIRAHAQTIGMLVAEKTELLTKITHLERLSEQRAQEIEEINQRQQSIRQHSMDLEHIVLKSKTELDHLKTVNTELTQQLDHSTSEVKRERSARRNAEAEIKEVHSKLNAKSQEATQLELQLEGLRRQLELSQVYTNYLTGPDNGRYSEVSRQGDWLSEQAALNARLEELETTACLANKERNRLETQYKALVASLEQSTTELRAELVQENRTKRDLELALENAERQLRSKEEELADAKYALGFIQTRSDEPADVESLPPKIVEETVQNCTVDPSSSVESLKAQLDQQSDQLTDLRTEVENLTTQLTTARQAIVDKEALLSDRDSVLATATSERMALGRAMEQNRTLKQQNTDLQDAFVKLTNDNMELTTALQNQQHVTHEHETLHTDYRTKSEHLQQQFAQLEADHLTLRQAYDTVLVQLEQTRPVNDHDDDKHCHQTKSFIIDKTERATADDNGHANMVDMNSEHHLVVKLQNHLKENQATIELLGHRAELLDTVVHKCRLLLSWLEQQKTSSQPEQTSLVETFDHNSHTNLEPLDLCITLDRLVREHIQERDTAIALHARENHSHMARAMELPSLEEWQALKNAHKLLEDKFVQCMDKLGHVEDERSRLETIVVQLEMEASTIGEYVTLFTHKRAFAARRAKAREQLLARLVEDRRLLRGRFQSIQKQLLRVETNGVLSIDGKNGDNEDGAVISMDSDNSVGCVQHQPFFLAFRNLFNDLLVQSPDEIEAETGSHFRTDEDAYSTADTTVTDDNTNQKPNLEQLRMQALQHDCPHCQCCVGTLMDV